MARESSVIYRRRNVGTVSVAAVTELMLFDAHNPRSLVFQLERTDGGPESAARSSGSSGPSGWSTR